MANRRYARNEQINQEFTRVLAEHSKNPKGYRMNEVYTEVAERFFLSEMQVRRIVRGYSTKP